MLHYSYVVAAGFFVWLVLAPRPEHPQYGELFLAYMTALLFCLIGTSEIMLVKPVAFFFTVGGTLAFFYVVARLAVRHRVMRR